MRRSIAALGKIMIAGRLLTIAGGLIVVADGLLTIAGHAIALQPHRGLIIKALTTRRVAIAHVLTAGAAAIDMSGDCAPPRRQRGSLSDRRPNRRREPSIDWNTRAPPHNIIRPPATAIAERTTGARRREALQQTTYAIAQSSPGS